MKKVMALVLALMMVLTCAAFAEDANVIKIGVFEPASGDNGAGGKQEVLGIEYANSLVPTVTIGDTEYTVELVVVDNQSQTDKAVTAAQTLVSEGVSVVLGSYGSGVSMAGGEVFAQAQVPAIGCSCTNPGVTSLCDYYWRICYIDPFQGTVMANFAMEQGAQNAYVLTQLGDDYSTGLGFYFQQAFESLGGTVVAGDLHRGHQRLYRLSEQRHQRRRRRRVRAELDHLRLADHQSGGEHERGLPHHGGRHLGILRHPRRGEGHERAGLLLDVLR